MNTNTDYFKNVFVGEDLNFKEGVFEECIFCGCWGRMSDETTVRNCVFLPGNFNDLPLTVKSNGEGYNWIYPKTALILAVEHLDTWRFHVSVRDEKLMSFLFHDENSSGWNKYIKTKHRRGLLEPIYSTIKGHRINTIGVNVHAIMLARECVKHSDEACKLWCEMVSKNADYSDRIKNFTPHVGMNEEEVLALFD